MSKKLLRSQITRMNGSPISLAKDAGGADVIQNVAVVSAGEAKGHGVSLDNEFVNETVRAGNDKADGVKARFGHPNASQTALGTFIGRFQNFRADGDIARADLHLSETAAETPNGNLKDYVLSMSKKEPDMFGTSIVFTAGSEYKKDEDGDKIYPEAMGRYRSKKGDDPVPYAEMPGPTFVELESLHAADVVDDPAANDGMFSKFSSDQLAAQATQFLQEHPDIVDLVESHPEVVEPFLERYRECEKSIADRSLSADTEKKNKNEGEVVMDKEKELSLDKDSINDIVQLKVAEALDEQRKEFASMIKEFGTTVACESIAAGESIEQCQSRYIKKLEADNKEANERAEKATTDLDTANKAFTGEAPVSANEGVEDKEELERKEEQAKKDARIKKYKSKVGSANAAFAAGLKIPNNGM